VSDTPKLAIGIFIVLVVLIVAAVLIWLSGGREVARSAAEVAVTPAPTPAPTPSLEERLSERLKGVTLSTSDAAIRQLAAGLSARPELTAWLANEDLVRRFVASVDSIADGRSPRQQVEFLRPAAAFRVDDRGDRLVLDPASYRRYDVVADVVSSLDTGGTVALLRELKPLIDDAYAEIAPPGRSFDDRLTAAIDQLLAVPVVDGDVELERKVVTYAYADPSLESLSAAQRQLLRMGPDNVRKIQDKLREIKAAITSGSGG
jgi:hypothetical protein